MQKMKSKGKNLYILFLLIITQVSCNNNTATTKYSNGKIKGKYTINSKNGLAEGITTLYYQNGVIKEIKNYHNDTAQGLFYQYYSNGRIKSKGYYDNNNINGQRLFYDSLGRLKSVYQRSCLKLP